MTFQEILPHIVNNPGFKSLQAIKQAGYRIVKERDGERYFLARTEELKPLLVKLGEIAEVNEGRPTGANNYFFIPKQIAEHLQLEKQYLHPALMKTRGKAFLELRKKHIERYFIKLPRERNLISGNIRSYLESGEKEIVPKSRTLRAKKYWWYFSNRRPAELIAPCGYGDRVWCAINSAKAITSNSYTEIRLRSRDSIQSVFFTLNHPIGWLFLELVGRVSLGGGMIKVDPIEYRHLLIIHIKQPVFVPFSRQVNPIFTECGIDPQADAPIYEQEPNPLPDRKALDDIVFDALGLTEEERKEVYRAVCQLVWERISKARSV